MSQIKELKTIIMDENCLKLLICVEIMNSKRQVYCKGEIWSRGINLNLMLYVT